MKVIVKVQLLAMDESDCSYVNPVRIFPSHKKERVDEMRDVYYENLRGTKSKSPCIGIDICDRLEKIFFVFDDLSVRVQSSYKIKCSLIDTSTLTILHVVTTEGINVESSRNFTGNLPTSLLTSSLNAQGLLTVSRKIRPFYQ